MISILCNNSVWKKYISGPRYWNVPVLVNTYIHVYITTFVRRLSKHDQSAMKNILDTGTFLVYQYCLEMWYLHSLECAGVIQKFTLPELKNGVVLSNTHVPVSGTWSILFPSVWINFLLLFCFVSWNRNYGKLQWPSTECNSIFTASDSARRYWIPIQGRWYIWFPWRTGAKISGWPNSEERR